VGWLSVKNKLILLLYLLGWLVGQNLEMACLSVATLTCAFEQRYPLGTCKYSECVFLLELLFDMFYRTFYVGRYFRGRLHHTCKPAIIPEFVEVTATTWYLVPGAGKPSPRLNSYLSLGEGLPDAPGTWYIPAIRQTLWIWPIVVQCSSFPACLVPSKIEAWGLSPERLVPNDVTDRTKGHLNSTALGLGS